MFRFILFLLSGTAALAADARWFPFPISVLDGSPSAIDLSYLNEKPAGVTGFVTVKGEHLLDGQGKPLRLYGTNFCGAACFPEPADAERVAAHLAKNGLNVVRLHHMDNGWGKSLIADTATTRLDEANLARMDKLVAELLKQGIYINLNLHVSRTYAGTPKGAPDYSKGLDHFHPPFIAAFQSYARQLLEHVNPHTGRAYKEEPGIALIEMNNENTLVLNPWWMAKLDEPFASELRSLFVKHLRGVYPSTAALQSAWGMNDGSTGPDLISNGDFTAGQKGWALESNFGAASTVTVKDKVLSWTSTASGTQPWSLQISQKGLVLEESKSYRLSFRARSSAAAQLTVHAQNAKEPWAQLGFSDRAALGAEWQSYSFEFSPVKVLPEGQNRIVFGLDNKVTSVELAEVRLVEVSTGYLRPEQTLEAGNIPLPERRAKYAVRRDFFSFLADLEVSHATEMKRFIREELGARQLISHSQVLFGGIVGARREALVSDVVDTHGYWHHPHFPNKSWDMADWTIENVSQITAKDGGTLAEMAHQRPYGKPYSVSEYDIPAPNDHAAETFPLLAAMASLQDWSAVYHFNFKHGADYDSDKLTSFFDLPGHPGKQAFVPLAALLYRTGAVAPAQAKAVRSISKGAVMDYMAEKAGEVWGSWRDLWWQVSPVADYAWKHRVGYGLNEESRSQNDLAEEPGTSAVELHSAEGWATVKGERALVCSGKLAGRQVQHAGFTFQFATAAQDTATLTLVSLDGKPLAQSKRLWLAALHRAENPGMKWDAERRSVGRDWGTGPAVVLGVEALLTLPEGTKWKVEALTPTGVVQSVLAEHVPSYKLAPEQKTVWWLLTQE